MSLLNKVRKISELVIFAVNYRLEIIGVFKSFQKYIRRLTASLALPLNAVTIF